MIEVGQVFLNGVGERVVITGKGGTITFPVEGLVTRPDKNQYREIYTEEGKLSKDVACSGDLIMSKPKFEVGKTYKNRQGDSVTIVSFDKDVKYSFRGAVNGTSYDQCFTIYGEYLEGEINQQDLVLSEQIYTKAQTESEQIYTKAQTESEQIYTKAQIESTLKKLGVSPTEFFSVMDAERLEYLRLKAIYGEST